MAWMVLRLPELADEERMIKEIQTQCVSKFSCGKQTICQESIWWNGYCKNPFGREGRFDVMPVERAGRKDTE
jgi:hypothetical protein